MSCTFAASFVVKDDSGDMIVLMRLDNTPLTISIAKGMVISQFAESGLVFTIAGCQYAAHQQVVAQNFASQLEDSELFAITAEGANRTEIYTAF